jgi:hypothetical protein
MPTACSVWATSVNVPYRFVLKDIPTVSVFRGRIRERTKFRLYTNNSSVPNTVSRVFRRRGWKFGSGTELFSCGVWRSVQGARSVHGF